MQYTIRVPKVVDDAVRKRARATGKSLNEALVDVLTAGAGVTGAPRKRHDFSDIAGTWKADKTFESLLADQHKIDKGLWRRGLR